MKNNRQTMILDIIAKEDVETQEQLLEHLRQRGITSTQATISRDIKQLHLVKEPAGHGAYKYAVSQYAGAAQCGGQAEDHLPRKHYQRGVRPEYRGVQNAVRGWQAVPARHWITWM